MRKADYLTVARELRKAIADFSPGESARLNETVESYERRQSNAMQAAQLARYFAEHLSVDRAAFLTACGIRT